MRRSENDFITRNNFKEFNPLIFCTFANAIKITMHFLRNCLLVMAGGAVGSVLRYVCSILSLLWGVQAHWGTMIVNAIGSFLIGILAATLSEETWTLLLVVGLCGGFTTYSTFSMQTISLLQSGNISTALLYITVTICVCLLFTYLGWKCKY